MVGLNSFKINHKGTGSKQYPPQMMLALLIYCYATGRFSSRIIEELVKKAEEADCSNNDNGLSIPEESKDPTLQAAGHFYHSFIRSCVGSCSSSL